MTKVKRKRRPAAKPKPKPKGLTPLTRAQKIANYKRMHGKAPSAAMLKRLK